MSALTPAELRDQVFRTCAQCCLLGDGTTTSIDVAEQMGLTARSVGQHLSGLTRTGLVAYAGAPFPPQRWRISPLGTILITATT